MSRKLKVGLGLGLGMYFIFLVVSRTPAEWATYFVTKNSPMIELYGVSGTVWKGKVAKAKVNLAGSGIDIGEVRWKLQTAKLLLLRACADVESTMLSSAVCRSVTGKNSVQNLRLDVPASLASPFVAAANFNGQTSWNLSSGSFSDQGFIYDIEGNVSWRNTQVQVEGFWLSLGDFGADLTPDGQGGLNASIFDLKSPINVKLNANADLKTLMENIASGNPDRPYSIEGDVIPSDSAPPQIAEGLQFVAVPLDGGGFKIKYPFK